MPDGVRCCDSRFQDCQFIVCRLADVEFWDASLYSCEFHSCLLQGTIFADSTLAHTHFHDCDMPGSAFIRTRLKNCNTMDCTIGNLNLANAILDGASYSRITRLPGSKTRHLDTATITMGGATDEEVETLKHSIFKALQVPEQPQVRPRRTKPHRGDAR